MTGQPMYKASIYVVDSDYPARQAVGRLLATQGFAVECFVSAESMLTFLPEGSMGCALLDVRLPGVDGPQLQKLLSTHSPAITVVFLTGHDEIGTAVSVMKWGALDYLLKPATVETLIPVVLEALMLSAAMNVRLIVERSARLGVARLTARERQVMEHVVNGRLNKQVAADLGIKEKTVKVHRSRVMAKMDSRNVPDLVRKCEVLGVGHHRSLQQSANVRVTNTPQLDQRAEMPLSRHGAKADPEESPALMALYPARRFSEVAEELTEGSSLIQ